jgi:hypothetical protein
MVMRRDVMAAAVPLLSAFAGPARAQSSGSNWDQGQLTLLLPAVNHERALIKAPFRQPLTAAPVLQISETRIVGVRGDSAGLFWQFHAAELRPGTPYRLTLRDADGGSLAEPWTLKTFPAPNQAVLRMRLLMYSCAAGHDLFGEAHTGLCP